MKEKNGEHPFGDAGQIILLAIYLILWVMDSFIWLKTTFIADYVSIWIRFPLFVVMIIFAGLLFKSAHRVVQHEDRLTQVIYTGGFRFIRHPLYSASLLFYLGMTILTMSLLSFVLFLLIFLFYNHIAGYEEILLERKFGDEYRGYQKQTGKWIPKKQIINLSGHGK